MIMIGTYYSSPSGLWSWLVGRGLAKGIFLRAVYPCRASASMPDQIPETKLANGELTRRPWNGNSAGVCASLLGDLCGASKVSLVHTCHTEQTHHRRKGTTLEGSGTHLGPLFLKRCLMLDGKAYSMTFASAETYPKARLIWLSVFFMGVVVIILDLLFGVYIGGGCSFRHRRSTLAVLSCGLGCCKLYGANIGYSWVQNAGMGQQVQNRKLYRRSKLSQ